MTMSARNHFTLDQLFDEAPPRAIDLPSGRRCEVESAGEIDRIVVRARGGEILLRIEVGEHGPVLSFSGAELCFTASRRIAIDAEDITMRASRDMRVDVGGDRHARVGGVERLEAARVETQASEGSIAIKAAGAIALDGEHIGLNDDPAPAPFAWSSIASAPGDVK